MSATIEWDFEDITAWGGGPHVAPHRLHESGLFTPEAIADLLDRIPRSIVHPYTMGSDPTRTDEWRRGQATDLPGSDLLDVVAGGRLWLNLVGVGDHDPAIGRLVAELYDEIAELVPGFAPRSVKATLLISSPGAQVYYHADNQPNALWHLAGTKRVWAYPRGPRFVTAAALEKVVAGVSDEQLPYRQDFDASARVIDLEPGQVAWWPQNSPHRVVNTSGLNISLSTEHRTAASTRREQVVAANHLLRTSLGRQRPSEVEDGLGASAKIAVARAARRLVRETPAAGPAPSFAIDPSMPDGVRST